LKKYKIIPKIKKGEDKAQFLFNHKVGYKNSQIYKNVDDAKGAPLIQQLFFLPFVKSVTLEEKKLIVERFNILEWDEVADEVCEQLENYLNNGGSITEKIPTTIYAESTPNPSVMKFVANKSLVPESFEFKNIDEAKVSPLAQKLFHFPFIKEIFINSNYISITKYEINTWDEVVMEIREFVRSYLEEGNTVIEESIELKKDYKNASDFENLNKLEKQIVSILKEYIQPAVASDGGNIEFDSYDSNKKSVRVILQGACSGCPSSTLTLKNGIETMLKEMIPGKIENVIALNG
tara:strand:- start:1724 stop:2599 length:876 start_codon:yes stop_codon:yes gene_type:complete